MTADTYRTGDRVLGMDSAITRRDFLETTLLASGAALLNTAFPAQLLAEKSQTESAASDWNGFGGIGEYANSNGNTWEVLTAGHKLRGDNLEKSLASARDTSEIFDCVIVGGGISGLAAALFFMRQAGPNATTLILENHPIFGGEAKQNGFDVDGQRLIAHQGSAIYFAQYPRSFLAQFYDSIGLKEPHLEYQQWGGRGPEMPIGRTPYDSAGMSTGQYGFWFGAQFGKNPAFGRLIPSEGNLQTRQFPTKKEKNFCAGIPAPRPKPRRSRRQNMKAMQFHVISIPLLSKNTTSISTISRGILSARSSLPI